MTKHSAGLLLYRFHDGMLEVFLVHPGGPFWEKKDLGVWSIPKGEMDEGEDPLEAARREFEEETGFRPEGVFRELSTRPAEKRKDCPRLGRSGGLRSGGHPEQYLHHGVAAALRKAAGVSGGGPGRVVCRRSREGEDPRGSAGAPRAAGTRSARAGQATVRRPARNEDKANALRNGLQPRSRRFYLRADFENSVLHSVESNGRG